MRTVIDLRNRDERPAAPPPRPRGLRTVELPLDGAQRRDFWEVLGSGPHFATPLHFRAHIEAMPARTAAVVAAVARAPAGGVLVHCASGRDRTGQVAMAILALAGVPAEEIAADYARSRERLRARHAARGEEDQGEQVEAFLRERGLDAGEVIAATVRELDLEARLLGAQLDRVDLVALRRRLLAPAQIAGGRAEPAKAPRRAAHAHGAPMLEARGGRRRRSGARHGARPVCDRRRR